MAAKESVQVALDFVADATGVKSEAKSIKESLGDLTKMAAGMAFGGALQQMGANIGEHLSHASEEIEKTGMAALDLQRQLGGTAEAAWTPNTRIPNSTDCQGVTCSAAG